MCCEERKIEERKSDLVGSFCLVRCRDAGVHAGVLVERSGRECVLEGSYRLWRWQVEDLEQGFALYGVAKGGLDKSGSKVEGPMDRIILTEACEIMPCSQVAAESIRRAV